MSMNKKVAILQSSYIPWKGYFDLIAGVDGFIIFDEMQYTSRDWRSRNKIKTPNGLLWLTIPVSKNRHFKQKINETLVSNKLWSINHLKTINRFYPKAVYYKDYKDFFANLYNQVQDEDYLCQINKKFIVEICRILDIETKISWSTDYKYGEGKTERLVDLCQQAGATEYVSGPAAKDYIQTDLFEQAEIKPTWMDYSGYKEYKQLYPPFEHGVKKKKCLRF